MEENFKMTAKTLFGFESILANELRRLGAMAVKEGVRSVTFIGDKGFMYKANLALRTAIRILKPIKKFKIYDEHDLYKKIQQIHWEDYFHTKNTFAIEAAVHSEKFTHSHYISLKTKDAIVDYFRDQYQERPSIDLRHPDMMINIHIKDDVCTVSLDSSGSSLHKRGYRSATNIAPINEVFAAGLILMSGYNGSQNFLDPMCGSGTMLIEAAMIANNIPANINRPEFGFEKWLDFDEELFNLIHDSLLKKITSSDKKIMGFDKAPSAVRKAKDNVKNAGLEEFITVEKQDFFDSENPLDENTIVCFNPPYGERLEINVPVFYKEIGNTLKKGYSGTNVWFITSDFSNGLKSVGLRTSRKIKVYNGKLECRFVKYEMYKGTRKIHKIK